MIALSLLIHRIPAGTKIWERPKPNLSQFCDLPDDVAGSMTMGEWVDQIDLESIIAGRAMDLDIDDHITTFNYDEHGNELDLGVVEGVTTKELFLIEDVSQIEAFNQTPYHDWAVESMREGGWADLYEFLSDIRNDVIKVNTKYDESVKQPHTISVLTCWETVTGRDWESGIDEIEGFTYMGLALIVPSVGQIKAANHRSA